MIRVAAGSFDTWETVGMPSVNQTAAPIEKVFGPLRTAVLILAGDGERICLVAPNLMAYSQGLDRLFQKVLGDAARVDPSRVMVIHSHNHTSPKMSDEPPEAEWGETERDMPLTLTPVGEQFFDKLAATATRLADQLQPVSLSWAVGEETTLSYNRKGRRADGTTYLMREPNRLKLGPDSSGEIDDFIRRAEAGDPNTLDCVGLNFTEALSPRYLAALVRPVQRWNQWAREIRLSGTTESVPQQLEMECCGSATWPSPVCRANPSGRSGSRSGAIRRPH